MSRQPAPVGSVTVIAAAADAGVRLDRFLAAQLPALVEPTLTRAAVQRLITRGAVDVNGRTERHASSRVVVGSRVVCRVEGLAAAPGEDGDDEAPVRHRLDEAAILYEDDWLIAVDKPPGLPTHATIDPARSHLHRELAAMLERRDGAGRDGAATGAADHAERYLGIHHRLDRDTSGVVVFAKDRRANPALAAAFARRTVRKTYLAVCSGRVPAEQWSVRDHLGRVSATNRAARYGAVGAGGDAAHTDFAVQRRLGPRTVVVQATPHTGRTHQIRVHLAGCGLPIVGDVLYGGPPGPRALLHAWRLELPHPHHGGLLHIEAPLPPDIRRVAPAGDRRAARTDGDPPVPGAARRSGGRRRNAQ